METKDRIALENHEKCGLLIVTNSFQGGGAENFIIEYCKYLDCNRIPFVCVVINQLTIFEKERLPRNGLVIELKKIHMRHALFELIRLISILRPRRIFSSILPLNCFFGLLAKLYLKNCKVIVRNPIVLTHHFEDSLVGRLKLRLYLFSLRKIDKIFCQSKDMFLDLNLLAPHLSSKAFTIPNPFRYRFWDKLKEHNFDKPGRYSKTEPFEFCWIGRLEKQKNLEATLIALSTIKEFKWKLKVAGTGSQQNQLKRKARELGIESDVKFLGFLNDPWIDLAKCDALILSSRYEGNPNVALEAISLHMPVISLPTPGGINELKERFPSAVILAHGNAPSSLAMAIKSWVNAPQPILGIHALEELSPDVIFQEYTKHIFSPG